MGGSCLSAVVVSCGDFLDRLASSPYGFWQGCSAASSSSFVCFSPSFGFLLLLLPFVFLAFDSLVLCRGLLPCDSSVAFSLSRFLCSEA